MTGFEGEDVYVEPEKRTPTNAESTTVKEHSVLPGEKQSFRGSVKVSAGGRNSDVNVIAAVSSQSSWTKPKLNVIDARTLRNVPGSGEKGVFTYGRDAIDAPLETRNDISAVDKQQRNIGVSAQHGEISASRTGGKVTVETKSKTAPTQVVELNDVGPSQVIRSQDFSVPIEVQPEDRFSVLSGGSGIGFSIATNGALLLVNKKVGDVFVQKPFSKDERDPSIHIMNVQGIVIRYKQVRNGPGYLVVHNSRDFDVNMSKL